MRGLRTLVCVAAALIAVGCNCFVPPTTPSSLSTPPTDTTLADATTPVTVVGLSVQGATSLRIGETAPWQAVALLSNGTERIVTTESSWTSLTTAVASVSASGVVTGIAAGRATIRANYENQSASADVTILGATETTPTVAGLRVEGNTAIKVGESTQLRAIASMSNGTTQTVTSLASWTSEATGIATVSSGAVVGVAAGQAPIHASYGGQHASATVVVSAAPVTPPDVTLLSVTVSGNTAIQVGQTTQLTATAQFSNGTTRNVTASALWTSNATNVATVNAGLVTGLAVGTAPIQASYQGRVGSAGVVVTSPAGPTPTVTGLSISGPTSVSVGQSVQLQATAQLSDGSSQVVTGSATWSSLQPSIATVSAGLVSGIAAGNATIRATYSGRTADAPMTVTAPTPPKVLTGIEVNATVDLTKILLNQPIQITVFGVYSDGSKMNVTNVAVYSSDNPDVRVDVPGTILVTQTLVNALLDPNHVVNVQYGGFTEAVNLTLQLPVIQSMQLGTGGVTTIQIGSQLPAVQGFFSGGATANLASDFPGLTWSLQPRGALGTALGLLGINLNNVLTVTNGQITTVSNTLLNQVIGLVGSALPVDIRASYNGITSNVMQANVTKP